MLTAAKVLIRPQYLALSAIVALVLIAFAAWLPNLHLITKAMTSSSMTLAQRANLATGLLGALETNFTFFTRSVIIVSGILAGVQISLMVYYVRTFAMLQGAMGTSFTGMLASLIGVGCASCGSVILSTFFGLSATAGFLGLFPFKGQELGAIGIFLLLISIYITVKKIENPQSCRVILPKEAT